MTVHLGGHTNGAICLVSPSGYDKGPVSGRTLLYKCIGMS